MPFSYSHDEENYTGEFATREDAVKEAVAEGRSHFWTAENRKPDILAAIDASRFIEEITELNDDFGIEQAEGWPDSNNGQRDQLEAMLRETFQRWVTTNNLEPKFWIADDVQEHHIQDQGDQASEQ